MFFIRMLLNPMFAETPASSKDRTDCISNWISCHFLIIDWKASQRSSISPTSEANCLFLLMLILEVENVHLRVNNFQSSRTSLFWTCALHHDCSSFPGEDGVRSECVCDEPSCDSGERCFGQQCFTSMSVVNGTSVVQRGCIASNEDASSRCGDPAAPELVVECCYGHLCNMNVSLQFPVKGKVFPNR